MVSTISQLARQYGIAPQVISTLFYRRVLDDQRCPVISGRRIIPADYVPEIEAQLKVRGIIRPAEVLPA